jgi:hypothetical protein
MATKKASTKKTASKSRKASASKAKSSKAASSKASGAAAVIKRTSLTVGVGRRSALTDITKQLQRALGEAGCTRCLSGLERLILDARVNPR